jgi:2-keto-4-pentenoate hydratase
MAISATRRPPPGQEAMLAEMRRRIAAGATRVGWKVGHAIAEAEGVVPGGLVVGGLTSATLLRDGGTHAAGYAVALRAETEVVAWIGEDLTGDPAPDAVSRAIAGVGVGLELVDVARPPGGLRGIVAANVFHRAVVLGPCASPLRSGLGPATLVVGGRRHDGDEPFPDLVDRLGAACRLLAFSGESIRGGDVVLGGSVVHVAAYIGDELTATIGGLGAVRASIVSGTAVAP